MNLSTRRTFALMLVALLLLAVNLRLAVTTASVLLPLLIDEGALTPRAAILIPALPTAMFAVGGVFTPWLSRRIGAVAAVTWAMAAVAVGMLVRFAPHSAAIVGGTVLATAGIAVVNVMLPALVRATSGSRIRSVTTAYTTVLSASAAIGASAGVPVAHVFGSASVGLGSWAVFALLALVVWVVAARGHDIDGALAAPVSQVRTPLPQGTWALTVFFALQALLAFVIMGWLPTIAVETGISPARAGVLLGIVIVVSIPAGIVAVSMAHTLRGVRIGVVAVSLGTAVGMLGLWLAPSAAPELWAVLMGVGMAAFPLTLALIARAGSGAAEATRVSGVAQGVGYAISTVGPLGAGAWYSSGGEWAPVLVVMIAGAVLQGLIGLILASAPRAPKDGPESRGTTVDPA
ncbi:MFS transporter [Microbacterium esteraromaticum]|uniref:MFS transporter n=1 Tax=Microbacterium esteraromaticum TaxID=57043 RepID=A0A7D8AJC5_9MICO|nr:MFS transporter [Microbacterium esteraromaticum]QMU97026.1 MFS transporter [Microbacterium esteraromaticum]